MIVGRLWPRAVVCALAASLVVAACGVAEDDVDGADPGDGRPPVSSDEDPQPPPESDPPDAGPGDDDADGDGSTASDRDGPDAPSTDDTTSEPATGLPEAPGPPEAVVLSDAEVLPNAKRLASDVVQRLTTYEPDDRPEDIARRVVDEEGIEDLLRSTSLLYHEDAWSRGEIVYPQLGGATATDASVMVVVRQQVGVPAGEIHEVTRTVDVRLTLVDDAWTFVGIQDAGGEPVPRPSQLPPEAVAVLDDDRIELPDSAVWDIHAGRTRTSLLEVMSQLADEHSYGVAVLETGHPVHVFDTDRISTHLYGLAVDIYHVDGVLVVDDREEGSTAHTLARWLYDRSDVTNLGSPWALDGFGGRSFTDLVHQDHFHIEAGPRPSGPPPHREDLARSDEETG